MARLQTGTTFRACALWLLLGLVPVQGIADELRAPVGLDNPTLAFNLDRALDYNTGFQFLDQMKMTTPWIAHLPGQWGGVSWGELKRGGHLDADGWLTSIPDEVEKVGVLWRWGEVPDSKDQKVGRYILDYEGTGTLKFRGDARVISERRGQIVFENRKGGHFFLNIHETDPAETGDYIRNITIVREDRYDLFEAGAVFNPDWLRLIEDARQIRVMNWTRTMKPGIEDWEQMPSATAPPSPYGTALADIVTLANQIGTEPWFTMPHTASDDYIRGFATYVRDNLDSALKVRVEYSNEAWNWAFPVTHWLHDQALEEWGEEGGQSDYYVKRSVEVMRIWEDVFGAEAETRLVRVLAGQAVNTWLTGQFLAAPMWREHEPDQWVSPSEAFDEFSITNYFGGKETAQDKLRKPFLAAIKDPEVNAARYLREKMQDPGHPASVAFMRKRWAEQKALAARAGLKLSAYEGGSHLHHLFATGVSEADNAALTEFFKEFAVSEEMAAIYGDAWEAWKAAGDGPFMQLTDIGTVGKWGAFGLRKYLDDNNPSAVLLDRLNAETSPWWEGVTGGPHFQQGITETGSDKAETLIGTPQEDFLIGKAGDDTFRGGPEDDGLHGGPGTDRALFSGRAGDYTIRPEGKGYRVDGPDGSDFLIWIEEIAFDETGTFVLADMEKAADGTLRP